MGLFDKVFRKDVDELTKLADLIGQEVHQRISAKLQDEFVAIAEVEQAQEKVLDLTKQLSTLKIEKDRIEEGFQRKEREIEHKVGLIRLEIEAGDKQKTKEFELKAQEIKLEAKGVALAEREKAFTERMEFIQKRFENEVGYLKGMVEQVLQRLPDATILGTKEL